MGKVRGRYMIRVDGEEVVAPQIEEEVEAEPEPTTISSTNTKLGIEQFLAFKGFDMATISNHGCYCSELTANAYGQPADDLDKICKDWIDARKCSLRNGGECFNAPDTEYTADTANCSGLVSTAVMTLLAQLTSIGMINWSILLLIKTGLQQRTRFV